MAKIPARKENSVKFPQRNPLCTKYLFDNIPSHTSHSNFLKRQNC